MILDHFRLDGKIAIVTGAGRGIGAASALALAECGADLVLAARTEGGLETVAGQVREVGRKVETLATDLNDLENLPALVETAMNTFGRLDIVVNVVGGTDPSPFLDMTPTVLEDAFHWNVTVASELTRLSVPHMLESGGGAVVNIGSALGHMTSRGLTAYAVGKAGLEHLTRALAADLAPRIRVNAVSPGTTETEALMGFMAASPELAEKMTEMIPLHRIAKPHDVALAVLYLASDASSYLTGKVLQVDGGIEAITMGLGFPDL